MGFFDEWQEPTGSFLSAPEKLAMLENGIPFEVVGIMERVGQFGPEFTLSILAPDPETGEVAERAFSFAKGSSTGETTSRDNQLFQMKEYLQRKHEGDPTAQEAVEVKFDRIKQFWKLVPAA